MDMPSRRPAATLSRPTTHPAWRSAANAAGPVAVPVVPAVEMSGVSWGPARGPEILADIAFAVPQGQIVAVCGANGAGKSSLLRLIYRHQAPRRGTVRLLGRDLWQMRAAEAARSVAAVLQEQPSDFALTVRQVVALGRLPHRSGWAAGLAAAGDDTATTAAIARMDLSPLSDRLVGTLSGGERQRVIVARALAQEPKVIVLDEPTNHLDIRHQLELLHLLRGLGLTVIATLHDLTLAAGFADRVLLLAAGRILADGPPVEALTADTLERAFRVKAKIDGTVETPRFTFHL